MPRSLFYLNATREQQVFMKNNIYNLATYIQDRAKESDPRGVKKENKRLNKNSLLR